MESTKSTLVEPIVLLMLSFGVLFEGFRVNRVNTSTLRDIMGPGSYIIVLGGLLALVTFIHIVINARRVLRQNKQPVIDSGQADEKNFNFTILAIVAIMAFYLTLIQFCGYLIATPIFFILLFWTVGVDSWLRNVALTVTLSAAYYIVFVHYCEVIFPRGLFFR